MNPSLWSTFLLLATSAAPGNAFTHRSALAPPGAAMTAMASTTNRPMSQQLAPKVEDDPIATIDEEDIDEDEADVLVDSITEKLGDMEGLWYSDDFYGSHGREWVNVKTTLRGECATSALEAVKVTGDPNVPAGCVTFQTQTWPGVGEKVAAEIQVRADPTDPDGFSWLPGELTLVAKREIRLMCQYNLFMQSTGTFYKENDEDDGEGSQ